ncbi:MAG: hypothetical protein CO145_01720 [Candidatus Nealsonbacteria bacterium CG_4_9_14_3_um_filter_37_13]|uniref:FIST domain-containing protein n=2 Tax=Candidatus Nealsoniibacteriota TaxID=1817911 RepID=A0A2H0TIV6_9BACT|nr:MAG: hypothetical protein COU43_02445 [Candidatus Nealsonbacteria bacterium CG10_big_fil_rev_8_21_14_0_10_37_25]PJA84221.1 MAG: hypothetical protein CO145_01720 [Candidatus Nealsonbacteria bacterium CG_4_9_14_3_um_filter_37_13]
MNKKILIGLIVVIVVVVGLIVLLPKEKKPLEVLPPVEKPVKTEDVGYGWSVKDTAREATEEAVAMMKEKLEEKNPNYVLLWYTIAYNPTEIKDILRELLGPNVQIQGNSSAVAVMSPDGYHLGPVGSLAIMGIASDKVTIGVGGASLDEMTPREAGRKAIQEAMANSGKEGNPRFIYITATPGQEEGILLGIEDIIGTDIPIIGGSAGDETLQGKWSNIANDNVSVNGVVLGAVYTDLKIGQAHEFGYMKTVKQGIVTRAEGRTLYEIDERPAAEVYNEWAGNHFAKELAEGGMILAEATFYPIAKIVKGEKEQTYLCVSHPGIINLPEKSITMFTDIETGDEIMLLHGNWEWLVNRAQSTARLAMRSENISSGEGLFAFYTFCAGTLLAIPEGERAKVPSLLRDEIGDIPFVGGFTLGEQIFMPGVGNRHANLVNSLAIFK